MGTSRGLHIGAPGFRHFFRGDFHVQPQAAVRLSLHGRGHYGDLHSCLHGLAASFFHHGSRGQRQRYIRPCDDDHRGPDRSEGFQLAVHDAWRPNPDYSAPMLWSIGFLMVTFILGGMTGVVMAVPPADFVLHNSLFLVAHFHNVIIGGVLFGGFAGYAYWFPKGVRI